MSFVLTRSGRGNLTRRMALAGLVLVPIASACGGTAKVDSSPPSAPGAPRTTVPSTRTALSCTPAAGAEPSGRAAVVVEPSASVVVVRCLPVSSLGLAALSALHAVKVSVGTQRYSFGLGICQVDDVPAHYSSCLPAGQPFWALFVAQRGGPWVTASTGISGITLKPGDSLGLRYDPPTGKPQPPSVAPPAP